MAYMDLANKKENTMSTTTKQLNQLIETLNHQGILDTSLISDGYHTFGELYKHRIALFIYLVKTLHDLSTTNKTWIYKRNHDGIGWSGWFGMGINFEEGKQITYHLPIEYWDSCLKYVDEVWDINPYYDGHTGADVIERLLNL